MIVRLKRPVNGLKRGIDYRVIYAIGRRTMWLRNRSGSLFVVDGDDVEIVVNTRTIHPYRIVRCPECGADIGARCMTMDDAPTSECPERLALALEARRAGD